MQKDKHLVKKQRQNILHNTKTVYWHGFSICFHDFAIGILVYFCFFYINDFWQQWIIQINVFLRVFL